MKMLIGELAVNARDGKTINVINPATQEVIDTVPAATKEDVEDILTRARQGFEEWSKVPLYKRINILKEGIARIRAHRDELWTLLQKETGKTVAMATGCFDGSMELADHYIETARIFGGDAFPAGNREGTEGHIVMTIHEPLGVVAVVLPFNFPIDAYMHKVIPALLMGNAVIIKPASYTPLTDIRMTELLRETSIPGNALQLVTGSGAKVGDWLIADDRVDMVTLTGSTRVGIEIAQNSATYLHRLHLELGGNDPFIILGDADLDEAVEEAFVTRLVNAGQRCCAGKRFIVHNSIKKAFTDALIEKVEKIKIGNPIDASVECGPLISERTAKEIEQQLDDCVAQGAKILCGGKKLEGAYFQPTVMEITKDTDATHDLELFGPVWSIIGFDTVEDAICIANDTMYGLSSGVIGKDMKAMMKIASSLKAEGCVVNGSGAFRSSDQPFGGYKKSGLGHEGGKYTLDAFTQLKTIILKNVL